MKIEVWSDYVCPYCYIGKRSLEHAVEEFPYKENVVIEYKSYELDPDALDAPGILINEYLAKKYQVSMKKVQEMIKKIEAQAKELDLGYNVDRIQYTNSLDAHRLTKLAIKEGKGNEIVERLFKDHFVEGKSISDHSTLMEIAKQVGLNSEKVGEILDSCKYTAHVRDDQDQAMQMGMKGVPFFVFNEKYALAGAQPVRVIREVLDKVWEEEPEETLQNLTPENSETTYCTDDGCQVDRQKL